MMNEMTVKNAADKKFRIGCQSWGYDDWITPAGGDYDGVGVIQSLIFALTALSLGLMLH